MLLEMILCEGVFNIGVDLLKTVVHHVGDSEEDELFVSDRPYLCIFP